MQAGAGFHRGIWCPTKYWLRNYRQLGWMTTWYNGSVDHKLLYKLNSACCG